MGKRKKKLTQKQQTAKIKGYVSKLESFELKKAIAIQNAEDAKGGKKLTKEERRKAIRNIKSGLSKEERKELSDLTKSLYKDYSKAHRKSEKIYGIHVAEKASKKSFTNLFYNELKDLNTIKEFRKEITDVEEFRELSDYSYRTKFDNFKSNQKEYQDKRDHGITLTPEEEIVANYNLPKHRGRMPMGEIINLVNYFDHLGLSHVAFDSPGKEN